MTIDTGFEYLSAFRERHALCLALTELSREQHSMILEDRYPELIDLLQHKQQLIDRMRSTDSNAQRMWNAWPEARRQLSESVRREGDQLLAQISSQLQQILTVEQDGTQALMQRRTQTLVELRELLGAEQSSQAYRSSGAGPPVLLDFST